MTLQDYLADPCGRLSIPWWKNKEIAIPSHLRIVHQRDFDADLLNCYEDEPYFRLKHDLRAIPPADDCFHCRTAGEDDLPLMVNLINRSYTDLSMTEAQLRSYRATAAFAPDLWIILLDAQTQSPVGCGLADFDLEAREGVLEWIQVLPEHRGCGAGQCIVNELLRRMQARAEFATVSGKVNNVTRPEALYRRCGFAGEDVWHILTQK